MLSRISQFDDSSAEIRAQHHHSRNIIGVVDVAMKCSQAAYLESGPMTLALNLPRCGSSLSIYRYDGDGVHVPAIAWLKDENGEFWKFEFNCPSEMENIPPDDFEDQREILMSSNAKQKQLEKDLEQDDSAFSSINELMGNETPSSEIKQQNFAGSSSSSSYIQNEKKTIATKQRTPETKPPANEPQHFANTSSWQWEPWHDTRSIVAQAYGSQWETQKARRSNTWEDKWSRGETVDWKRSQKPGTVKLPRPGSTVKIHKYIGEGNLVPTVAWLKDENDQLWMVQLQRQAQLTDILPHKWYQNPGKELFSKNEQQQKLRKEKDQDFNNICQSLMQILEQENCKFVVSSETL